MSKIVIVRDIQVGSLDNLVVMAGPCAVESKDQLMRIAGEVKEAGADFLRGGAYKPRTSGGEWKGLQEKGLEILSEASSQFDIPVITEILDPRHIPLFLQYGVGIFQIGARSAQVQVLLEDLGKEQVPVLYKNGMNTSHKEWMGGLKHITEARGGSDNILLCMRGRNVGTEIGRNSLDLVSMAHYARRHELPLIVDPSHAAGQRNLVYDVAISSVAAGADGLLIETHNDPMIARTDGAQSILPAELRLIVEHARDERARYQGRSAAREKFMRNVQMPAWVTVYFKKDQLEKIQPFLNGQAVKQYLPHNNPSTTDIMESRMRHERVGELLNRGYALGQLHRLYKEYPEIMAINVSIKGMPKVRLSPYEAQAIHDRGGRTSEDAGQFTRRIDMRHAYVDSVRNAFFTWEPLESVPLVLYQKIKG